MYCSVCIVVYCVSWLQALMMYRRNGIIDEQTTLPSTSPMFHNQKCTSIVKGFIKTCYHDVLFNPSLFIFPVSFKPDSRLLCSWSFTSLLCFLGYYRMDNRSNRFLFFFYFRFFVVVGLICLFFKSLNDVDIFYRETDRFHYELSLTS